MKNFLDRAEAKFDSPKAGSAKFQKFRYVASFYLVKSWPLEKCPLLRSFSLPCCSLLRGSSVSNKINLIHFWSFLLSKSSHCSYWALESKNSRKLQICVSQRILCLLAWPLVSYWIWVLWTFSTFGHAIVDIYDRDTFGILQDSRAKTI